MDAIPTSDVTPAALPSLGGVISDAAKPKLKKCIVKMPLESPSIAGPSTEDNIPQRPPWARNPLRASLSDELESLPPPDIITAEIYPDHSDSGTHALPTTIEVYLPGKVSTTCSPTTSNFSKLILTFLYCRVHGKSTRIKLSRRSLQS
jgi:hypothetical protein